MSESEETATTAADWDPSQELDIERRIKHMADVRERCPVAYTHRAGGAWGFLRYDDIVAATLDSGTYRNGGSPRHGVALPPLEVDPPEHREYRRLLTPFFTGKRMTELEPVVREFATGLLEPLLARGSGDLALEYSYPLPVLTLCSVLGFGADRWDEIKRISEDTLYVESPDAAERERARVSHMLLLDLARELIADRRGAPRDPESDLPSAVLSATIIGKPIDEEVAAGLLRLLISAGHNSTTSGVGNAILYFAQHPEEQQKMRANPELLPPAIEEILRWDTPVQAMPRYAGEDIGIRGRTIQKGEKIEMFWAAGNRDPAAFVEPDRCILDRKPNRHLTFGHGIHLCLGASMARLEIRIALECLLARTASFTLVGAPVRTRFHRVGVSSMPAVLQLA
jgi:cytochrome P450 family 130